MNKMEKLVANQKQGAVLQAKYAGLVSLHASAILGGDGQQETALRQQLHDTLDLILDNTAEAVQVVNEPD